jgi:hypothetical protein
MPQTNANWRGGVVTLFDRSTHERVNRLAPVAFYEDFITPSLVIPDFASLESGCRWAQRIVGDGPPTIAGAANSNNGTLLLHLNAKDQQEDAVLYFADQLVFNATQGLIFEARVSLPVLPTLVAEAVWGICGAYNAVPDTAAYSVWFTADGSGEIFCEKDDNATDQTVTSGVTVLASAYHIYRIDMTDVANVLFYIDGVAVAKSTTFGWAAVAGNSNVQPYIALYKASGAGLCDVSVDYVKLWQSRS